MRVFIGYRYSDRDAWIKRDVFPLVELLLMTPVDGSEMPGEELSAGVKERIDGADAVVCFCTLPPSADGQSPAPYDWVQQELAYALGKGKPAIAVREAEAPLPAQLIGNRQYIPLGEDRLPCVVELLRALSRYRVRRLQLLPEGEEIMRRIREAVLNRNLEVLYSVRFDGVDSDYRPCRVERLKGGIYITAEGVPDDALIEVQGRAGGNLIFLSDWESVDAVQIPVKY